jgi:hypothetical protein
MPAPANIINHYFFTVDESLSMKHLRDTTVKVFDGLIAHLAQRSRENGQETRVTVYFFSSYGTERCVIWDMDVLRVPSLAGLYHPNGTTALIRAVLLGMRDFRKIPQMYGDHSLLSFTLTDGGENDSARPRTWAAQDALTAELRNAIAGAPENETYACLVPDQEGVHEAKKHGFPAANVSVWNSTSARGMEEAGRFLRDVSDAFMEDRAQGIRGYSARAGGGLFKMRDFSAADVQATLTPLPKSEYVFIDVPADQPIRQLVESSIRTYHKGAGYYQFTKAETIQGYKQIAVETGGVVYEGKDARALLGLPDHEIRVAPDHKAGCTIFVQSTSVNRKLIGGTRLLLLR